MLDIIFNPAAARGKAAKALKVTKKILDEKGCAYKIHTTNERRHATELTKTLIEQGATDIIAMGGDGTVHEVLNGFSNFERVNLGIIPCGSGNDFVHSVSIPTNTAGAVDIILSKKAQYTDFMQLEGVRGINICGTGIDVEILQRCKKFKFIKGKFQYLLSLIISLFKFKNYNLKAVYNDKEEQRQVLIACVCNGKVFGGGIKVCPVAIADDGFLDYMTVFDVKKRKIPGAFIKLMKGKILEEPIAYTEKTKSIEILSDEKLTVNVDGELYENLPYRVEVVTNTLKLYRP